MRFDSSENYTDGLLNITDKKDQRIFTHIQNVTPIMEQTALERKHQSGKFSKKGNMRKIATIPINVALQHPEWVREPKLITQYLKTEQGKVFKTTTERL